MEKETIIKLNKSFEEYAYQQDGIDYWLAVNYKNYSDIPIGVIF